MGMTKNGNGATPGDTWEFDWNVIKRKEVKAMIDDQKKALEVEDDAVLFPWAARVIKRWPFALDPSDVKSYDELGIADYAEVMKRFYATFPRVTDTAETPNGG